MNKLDFLRRLNKELGILDENEKKEILGFYDERFYSGTIYENKTEEEVISELESPEVIARNVLEEYGVSPKYVKTKEERYTGVDPYKLLALVLFDLFFAVWLIPTLFSIVVGIFAFLVSYVGVIPLLLGNPTTTEEFMFAFATGAYVLVFIFGLVILELVLYAYKKILIFHLNVFKIRGRDKISKKLHKVSVDYWFKKHKLASKIRSIAFIGALVTLAYSGFHLFTGESNVFDEYANQPQTTQVHTQDLNVDILALDSWNIITDFDSMDIEIVTTTGTELVVTHKYEEFNSFVIDIDDTTNTLTISNDVPTSLWVNFNSILVLFAQNDSVKIEVPSTLILGDLDLKTLNGEIVLLDLEVGKIDAETTNGRIRLDSLTVGGNVALETHNGDVVVKNIVGTYEIDAYTSNGEIIFKNVEFSKYYLDTSNGEIILENLNEDNQDGLVLVVETSNGEIELIDVYVKDVSLKTSNGDINYHNSDETFELDDFYRKASNGDILTNMD